MWISSNDVIILMKYILSNENRQQKVMGYKLFSRISVGNLIMYFFQTLCAWRQLLISIIFYRKKKNNQKQTQGYECQYELWLLKSITANRQKQ